MRKKDPREKIFRKATALYEYFRFMKGSTDLKYPILEPSDIEEKKLVLEKLDILIKDFKDVANSYLKEEITLSQLESSIDTFKCRYEQLTYSYPALEGISISNNYALGAIPTGTPSMSNFPSSINNILNP